MRVNLYITTITNPAAAPQPKSPTHVSLSATSSSKQSSSSTRHRRLEVTAKQQHLGSLDVFRGLTVVESGKNMQHHHC
ncbi:hypothetical protein ACFX12_038582 [Malus domestica]